MKVTIKKVEDHWFLHFDNGVTLRSPFQGSSSRSDVVRYVRRSWPDALVYDD